MQIILLILKIIGIVLLAVLGILLFLLLSILFIPIQYHATGEKKDNLEVHVKVSWFLRIVYLRFSYKEDLSYVFRIFGYPIKNSENNQKEQEDLKEENRNKNTEKKQEHRLEKEQEKTVIEKQENAKRESVQNTKVNSKAIKMKKNEKIATQDFHQSVNESKEEAKKKGSVFLGKIISLKDKICTLKNKITRFWGKGKEKYDSLIEKKDGMIAFIEKEENKQGMKFLWEQVKKLLKHILPRKWNGNLVFGTGNPASTGKILGILSMLGGMAGVMPDIKPNFEKKVIEGAFRVKGKIYLYYVLGLLIKVWFDKRFQTLKNSVPSR